MARSPRGNAILAAAAAAKRLHRQLDLQARVTSSGGSIDVFEAITDLNIPLLFKPLDSAQGLCLPKPLRGILVTTKRTLNIQRFTAAHELGHVALDHEGSVDFEILERGPLGPDGGRDIKEVAAEAFAAEFLLPRWLYKLHVQRQAWSLNHLRNPDITYQLSLRLGASYEATSWGLLSHQILDRADVDVLLKEKVAAVKERFGDGFRPADSWADVWRITPHDAGAMVAATERDLIRVELPENSSGGYEWNIEPLSSAGLEVLDDRSDFAQDPIQYGAAAVRKIVARPTIPPQRHHVVLVERQPWSGEQDAELAMTLAFDNSETGGMSRAERRRKGMATP